MPIDISEYLNLVRTGTGVNDVRRGIAGSADEIAKYLGASDDISQELYDIKNGVYGKDIRAAIYSALDKLSKKEGGGSTDVFPSITDDFHRVEEHMLTGTVADEWEFAADSSEDFIPVPTPPPDLMPVTTSSQVQALATLRYKGGMKNGD